MKKVTRLVMVASMGWMASACTLPGTQYGPTPDAKPGPVDAPSIDANPDAHADAMEPPTIVATVLSLHLDEGGAAQPIGIRLSSAPAAPITIHVAPQDATAVAVSVPELTFTASDYATPKMVTVTALEDSDASSETTTVALSGLGVEDVVIAVLVTDDDLQGIVTDAPGSISIAEGTTNGVHVHLSAQPASSVVVQIQSSDASVKAVPGTMVFDPTNYNVQQTVSLTAVVDANTVDEDATVTLSAPGLSSALLQVHTLDQDDVSLVLSSSTLSILEGDTLPFKVHLSAQPPGNVTVNVASSESSIAKVSVASLTFTPANWNADQVVNVSAPQDSDVVDDTATIHLTNAAGLAEKSVAVTVHDDDVQFLVLSKSALTIAEDGNDTFNVRLAFEPTSTVIVNVTSSDNASDTASPTTLAFTAANYATPQTVSVHSVKDGNTKDESTTMTLSAPGLASKTVSVTNHDTGP